MKKVIAVLSSLIIAVAFGVALAGDTQSGNGTKRIYRDYSPAIYSANR